MIVDAHHHCWRYEPVEYGWIDDSMGEIRRDFLPQDLKLEISAVAIDAVVSVQARQSIEESLWLLALAEEHDFMAAVVGWLPLANPNISSYLEHFQQFTKLKGLRHVIQGEPDDNFILGREFNAGIKRLGRYNLVYDILVYHRHLPQTIEFVDLHPNQIFVLDHLAKPQIAQGLLSPWREHIVELARRPNVYCKLSGMVTEADPRHWQPAQLTPYFDIAINAFGPERLMFGSDWPVCLLGTSYSNWYELVLSSIAGLSAGEQALILGLNAARVYGFENSGVPRK